MASLKAASAGLYGLAPPPNPMREGQLFLDLSEALHSAIRRHTSYYRQAEHVAGVLATALAEGNTLLCQTLSLKYAEFQPARDMYSDQLGTFLQWFADSPVMAKLRGDTTAPRVTSSLNNG